MNVHGDYREGRSLSPGKEQGEIWVMSSTSLRQRCCCLFGYSVHRIGADAVHVTKTHTVYC